MESNLVEHCHTHLGAAVGRAIGERGVPAVHGERAMEDGQRRHHHLGVLQHVA